MGVTPCGPAQGHGCARGSTRGSAQGHGQLESQMYETPRGSVQGHGHGSAYKRTWPWICTKDNGRVHLEIPCSETGVEGCSRHVEHQTDLQRHTSKLNALLQAPRALAPTPASRTPRTCGCKDIINTSSPYLEGEGAPLLLAQTGCCASGAAGFGAGTRGSGCWEVSWACSLSWTRCSSGAAGGVLRGSCGACSCVLWDSWAVFGVRVRSEGCTEIGCVLWGDGAMAYAWALNGLRICVGSSVPEVLFLWLWMLPQEASSSMPPWEAHKQERLHHSPKRQEFGSVRLVLPQEASSSMLFKESKIEDSVSSKKKSLSHPERRLNFIQKED
eukprot:1137465-Pelagomonas_calceolata.AAC.8